MIDIGPVRRIILVQIAVTVTITLLMLMFQGKTAAISAFVGGAIGFLTSIVYAIKMIVSSGSEARKILRAHYSAEAYKLLVTILLFSLVFTQYKDISALPLFAAYAATLAVFWLALIIV